MTEVAKRVRPRHGPDELIPIPWPIAFDLIFLPPGLGGGEYEEAVRRIVRRRMCRPGRLNLGPGLMTLYDARVRRIMREVAEES